jgi:hypothetical protein
MRTLTLPAKARIGQPTGGDQIATRNAELRVFGKQARVVQQGHADRTLQRQ